MIAACDLADDLRDAIVEYQVSTDVGKRAPGSSLIQLAVLTAGGNLRADLQIDCESQTQRFEKTLNADRPSQDIGQTQFYFWLA